jgi:hypothetical protein
MAGIPYGAAICAIALSLAAGVPAWAEAPAPIDAAGARALQRELKTWLGAHLGSLGPDVSVVFQGALAVVPQGGLYRVTVPAWRATLEDGPTLSAGPTTIEVTPAEDDTFATVWTLPSELRFEDATVVATTVEIGRPSGQGLFDGRLHLFRELHLSLADIAATPNPADPDILEAHLGVGEIFFDLTATPAATQLWDVTGAAGIRGVDYREKTPAGETTVALGDLSFNLSSAGLDVPALLTFLSGVTRLDAESGVLSPAPSPQALAALAALMAETPKLFDDLGFGWQLSGLETSDVASDPATAPEHTALVAAGFSVAISRYREETADTGILGHLWGLTIGAPDELSDFVPSTLDIDLKVEDVPGSVMAESLRDLVRGGLLGAPEAAFDFAGAQILGALEGGAGHIRLGRLLLDFGPWALDLSGNLSPASASPIAFGGDLSLTISGIEAMFAQLGGIFGAPEAEDAGLERLIAIGRPTEDFQGRPARRYELLIDPVTGSLTVNGTDIEDLE